VGFWDGHAERVNHYATSIRIFRPPKFFSRKKIRGSEIKDIMWFNPGGVPRWKTKEWNTAFVLCPHPGSDAVMLSGDTNDVRDFYSRPIHDDTFLMP
jgi:glycogen operon protein